MGRQRGEVRRLLHAADTLAAWTEPTISYDEIWRPQKEEVRGTIQEVAFDRFQWIILLLIDGRWLPVSHKGLREAIAELLPEIGDEIWIVCRGKKGISYKFFVSVGERTWAN